MKWTIYFPTTGLYYIAWGEVCSSPVARLVTSRTKRSAFHFHDKETAERRLKFLNDRHFDGRLRRAA